MSSLNTLALRERNTFFNSCVEDAKKQAENYTKFFDKKIEFNFKLHWTHYSIFINLKELHQLLNYKKFFPYLKLNLKIIYDPIRNIRLTNLNKEDLKYITSIIKYLKSTNDSVVITIDNLYTESLSPKELPIAINNARFENLEINLADEKSEQIIKELIQLDLKNIACITFINVTSYAQIQPLINKILTTPKYETKICLKNEKLPPKDIVSLGYQY